MKVRNVLFCVMLVSWMGLGSAQRHAKVVSHDVIYVSPLGDDRDSGGKQYPLKTIHDAIMLARKEAQQGERQITIVVEPGVYHERVDIDHFSYPKTTLTLQASSPRVAIIDGRGLQAHDGGLITIHNSDRITVAGFVLQQDSTDSPIETPMGIEVSGYDDQVTLQNNTIRNIATRVRSAAGNAHGIGVYGDEVRPIQHLRIENNSLYDLTLGSSESLALNGNVMGFLVKNNVIHNNNNIGIDVIGFEGTAPNRQLDRARDGEILDNLVYAISSYGNPAYGNQYAADGIYVDGGTHILIVGNRVSGNDIGIELASEHHDGNTSYITMFNNLMIDNFDVGLSLGGYDRKRGYTAYCTIRNNLIKNNDSLLSGDGQILFAFDVRHVQFEHNTIIARANDPVLLNPYKQNTDNVVNGNIYQSPDPLSTWIFQWKNKMYTGVEAYRQGTGNDSQSLFEERK
nr:hypothetical protein [Bacilli bacterium]